MISCMKRGEHMTEHNAKEIGLRIRRQREALGYSRERLAELSEISNSFLADIERGDRGFSVALLGRLARVLGLSATISCSEPNRLPMSAPSQTCFPVWMGSICRNSRNF